MVERTGWLSIWAGKAIWSAVAVLLCTPSWTTGEILRLSKVVPEGTADATRFEYQNGEVSETLFIENQAIVTRADVESVVKSPQQADALTVSLTEEGGKKLGDATKDAQGDMRVAVLIDDKVVVAPVVRLKLGKNFMLEGLREYPDEELDLLAWRIEGKSDGEIAKLLRELEQVENTPPPPRPEPEYYSDAEYEALSKERAKVGIFYLGRLPTKKELDQRLKVGMTRAAVTDEFGRASRTTCDAEGNLTLMSYALAPERYSLSNETRPCSFDVCFSKDQVTRWGMNQYTNRPREAKPPKGGRRVLKAVIPKADFSQKNFDFVQWAEEIQLFPNEGGEAPTPQDYVDLLSIIHSCATAAEETALIEANCSVVKTLAEGFPEVEELRKTSKEGRISLVKLRDLLQPYLFGQKQFPDSPDAPKGE